MDTVKGNLNVTEHVDILDHNVLVWFGFPVHQHQLLEFMFFPTLVWKNLTVLHSTLTSTRLDTFGMNWTTDADLKHSQTAGSP